MASESSHYQVLVAIYAPIYMSLIDVLLQKSQYPPDDGYDSWGEGWFVLIYYLDIVCLLLYPPVTARFLLMKLHQLAATLKTRYHSSRVRTVQLPTICVLVATTRIPRDSHPKRSQDAPPTLEVSPRPLPPLRPCPRLLKHLDGVYITT